MADLLEGGGLGEEAREALREATLWTGKALAVENRLPEPTEMKESLRPPLSLLWGDAVPTLNEFASSTSPPPNRVTEVLQRLQFVLNHLIEGLARNDLAIPPHGPAAFL
jgi:hypothetical protein